ncbi:MAG: DNA polymerase I [Thermodesulfobacteriota bacterium]|nr:DNA polymerase I [Thermodesulfobacteriota bacterium]
MSKKHLILVDASAYIYRAFFALPSLSNSKGFPTGAIFGFTTMLLKLLQDFSPDYLGMIFDSKGPTFRNEIYRDYKANRPKMPDPLIQQIPYIHKITEGLNLSSLQMSGYEADDIIATVTDKAKKSGMKVTIISGDKDLFQIIDEDVLVADTMKDSTFGISEVKDRFGVMPFQIVDVMALSGDSTDNIPGVPGVGIKTASKLIKEFETLENLFKNLDSVKNRKLKENLIKNREKAILSKKLVALHYNVPIEFDFQDFSIKEFNLKEIERLFTELEFMSLLRDFVPKEQPSFKDYTPIFKREEFLEILHKLEGNSIFSIDLETTSKDPMQAEIVGISLAWEEDRAYYIPFGHDYSGAPEQLEFEWVSSKLKPLLESNGIKKVGQNIKFDYIVLWRKGIEIKNIFFDTIVASYLLNPSKYNHSLDNIALDYLGYRMISYKEITKDGKKTLPFNKVDISAAARYSCEDADITFILYKKLSPKISREDLSPLFYEVELPLIEVLSQMEIKGVKIDTGILKKMSTNIDAKLKELEGNIYNQAGGTFNINSPQQLGKVLFEELKLPVIKKTKTGYSTDMGVLSKLSITYELPALILEYRSLSKLKSTYIDSLPNLVNPETGRIHTSYNQTVTATGRLSSSDPNLQNIPIRTPIGKMIRTAFITEDGYLILSADYSQIELRITSHFAEDELLIHAFAEGEDIHTQTAAEVFDLTPENVTDEIRRRAKAINFGIIYGMGAYGLSQELGISVNQAKEYIDSYFNKYSGVKKFINMLIEKAKEKGYVTTLLGRRRYLKEIHSPDKNLRQFAERTAINTVIQGTAADLIKVAMINIHLKLNERFLKSRMIIQVHDELVFEVAENELDEVKKIVKNEMEGALKLKTPLKVDLKAGKHWGEV